MNEIPRLIESIDRPFSTDVELLPTRSAIINSEFILSVHRASEDVRNKRDTQVGLVVFALDHVPVIREDAKIKKPKRDVVSVGRVNFLYLYTHTEKIGWTVYIGKLKAKLIEKERSLLAFKIKSPSSFQTDYIEHEPFQLSQARAQEILNPNWSV